MKLRHLSGDNLAKLEQRLEDLGALVSKVVSVAKNGHWFIHYIESEAVVTPEDTKVKGVKGVTKPKNVQS